MLAAALRRLARILTFRFDSEDIRALDKWSLAVGMGFTWLAGVGRYWDNERVGAVQQAGVGSLVYVVVLGTFLFLLGAPLSLPDWSLFRVVTFVTQTAPPALLYAVPVERWLPDGGARGVNLAFLTVVSLWRVVLYAHFLRRFAGLRPARQAVLLLLPLCLIVVALTALNLERAVFDVMGGFDETTPADGAYGLLLLLSVLSVLMAPFLLFAYASMVWNARYRHPER
jgi:hypothetical protein